jgi:hypothetical protein
VTIHLSIGVSTLVAMMVADRETERQHARMSTIGGTAEQVNAQSSSGQSRSGAHRRGMQILRAVSNDARDQPLRSPSAPP